MAATVTVNGVAYDIETSKALVGAIDQRNELVGGCESWAIAYAGGQGGWMSRWPNGRGAACFGGDSVWGDWASDGLHLDDGEHVVNESGIERSK